MAQAAAEGMRAPAAADRHMVIGRVVAKPVAIERQTIGHSPAGGNDPMEVPDL